MNIELLNEIKRLVIIALVSDDDLMEELVLKGGNAIDLTYRERGQRLSRTSYDLDFSIASGDFDAPEDVKARIKKTLEVTFAEHGYVLMAFKFEERPEEIADALADFWGGYLITFKVISKKDYDAAGNPEKAERSAIALNPNNSPKFRVELSKYEYTDNKAILSVNGFKVYAYTPAMIAFEKLRALCQQLPDYKNIVPSFNPRARARDFYDIYSMMDQFGIDPDSPESLELIKHIFDAKKVPLDFIKQLRDNKTLHETDWPNVLETFAAGDQPDQPFDYYFEWVLQKFEGLTFL